MIFSSGKSSRLFIALMALASCAALLVSATTLSFSHLSSVPQGVPIAVNLAAVDGLPLSLLDTPSIGDPANGGCGVPLLAASPLNGITVSVANLANNLASIRINIATSLAVPVGTSLLLCYSRVSDGLGPVQIDATSVALR